VPVLSALVGKGFVDGVSAFMGGSSLWAIVTGKAPTAVGASAHCRKPSDCGLSENAEDPM
jgi:hypothetical protein